MTKFLDDEGLEHAWENMTYIINKKVYDAVKCALGARYGGYDVTETTNALWELVLIDSEDKIVAGIRADKTLYLS